MRKIPYYHEGSLVLNQNTLLSGTIEGEVVLTPGNSLYFSGLIHGDLVLQPDTSSIVQGQVRGNIINNGGYAHIIGQVGGQVVENKGTTVITPSAKINSSFTSQALNTI